MTKMIHKETVIWDGEKYDFEVYDDNNYSKLRNITQVYGFIFNKEGEFIIQRAPNKEWSLPGGTPENIDKDWKDTLIRETEEEANIEIKEIHPVMYIKVIALDKKATGKTGDMIRAIAFVKKINPRKPDPATGDIGDIKFIPPEDFLNYCKWGENGKVQLQLALKAKDSLKS